MRIETEVLSRNDEDDEVNLTPMLDVVFILLIFFIVTASFIRETGIDVNRPAATKTEPADPATSILIAISENNEYWMDRRMIDPRALRANIQRLAAEKMTNTVVVQADKSSLNNSLVQVMDAARAAGIYDISIATTSN